MATDASIYGNIRQPKPVNMLADYANMMQLESAQQQNAMGRMAMGEKVRGIERQNKLAGMLEGGADAAALRRGGFIQEANAWEEADAKRAKAQSELKTSNLSATQKQIELTGQIFGHVRANPTPENAAAAFDAAVRYGLMPAEEAQQFKTLVATDPGKISTFADGIFRSALSAKDQLFKTETRDAGGFVQTTATDPVSLKQTVIGQTAKTQSPDSAASVAATIRGQNLIDARARDRLAFDQAQPRGVLDPERGLLVDPRTGQARPVTMGGQPVGMKVAPEARKELMSINQQRAAIGGAIQAAEKSPSAFGLWRGLAASLPGGETLAGRMETMDETQARAYVFNNVSRIINERAGAAQSAQELARLQQFLPGASDNQTQIINKLKGFNKYLDDLERGTRTPSGGAAPAGNTGGASGSFGDDPLGLR